MICDNRIMIFGDSILKGVVLDQEQKYRVGSGLELEQLGAEHGLRIENHSRFGCTCGKGMAMLERLLARGDRPEAVVLGYGGNDADFDWAEVAAAPEAEHLPHTPLAQFTALYQQAIARLRALDIRPVLITLPPVCAGRYFRWITRNGLNAGAILRWLGDVEAIYRYQERYSRALETLARDSGCLCVDLRGALLQNRWLEPYYCDDGIHPNEAGQQVLHRAVESMLDSLPARPAVEQAAG